MKSALYIDADHSLDITGLLVSQVELVLLKRAVTEMATLSMTQDEQRRTRHLTRMLSMAIDQADDATLTDSVTIERAA